MKFQSTNVVDLAFEHEVAVVCAVFYAFVFDSP